MCFSATASLVSGTVLIPAGIYCILQARLHSPKFLLIALYPLAFGIQQLFEGAVWLSLDKQIDLLSISAYGFTFFSYFFWLWWVPISVWWLEPVPVRKNIAFCLSIIGFLYGGSLYFPLVLNEQWLHILVVNNAILYEPKLVYDGIISKGWLRVIYASIILIPLLIQSEREVRYFGLIILASVIVTKIFYDYAFISVWCFFAALLSTYIVYMLRKPSA